MRKKNLGYDKENLVYFNMSDEVYESYETVKQELLKYPSILKVTKTSSIPTYGYAFSNSLWHWEGQDRYQKSHGSNGPGDTHQVIERIITMDIMGKYYWLPSRIF